MRYFLPLILIILTFGFNAEFANASNGGSVSTSGSSSSGGSVGTPIAVPDPTEDLITQICEFRQMFCGGVAVTLVSITFVFIGILTLMHKINWGFVVAMVAAAIIFVNADKFATIFTGDDVSINCSC